MRLDPVQVSQTKDPELGRKTPAEQRGGEQKATESRTRQDDRHERRADRAVTVSSLRRSVWVGSTFVSGRLIRPYAAVR